jgi:hypothetical protein
MKLVNLIVKFNIVVFNVVYDVTCHLINILTRYSKNLNNIISFNTLLNITTLNCDHKFFSEILLVKQI